MKNFPRKIIDEKPNRKGLAKRLTRPARGYQTAAAPDSPEAFRNRGIGAAAS
jgi:hypothetical protein